MKEIIKIAKKGGWEPQRQYKASDWNIFTHQISFWKGLSKGLELDRPREIVYIVPAADRSQVRKFGGRARVIYFHVPRHKVVRLYRPRKDRWKKIWKDFTIHLAQGGLYNKYFDDLLRRG